MTEIPAALMPSLESIQRRDRDEFLRQLILARAEIDQLKTALKPFSDMAGELFARNWNADQIVTALDNPGDPHRVTAGDYFALRLALTRGQ